MTMRRWFRIALGYLAVLSAEIGLWAVIAPRSFYDDFPGLGRAWVSVDGPYNEHLVRDVGALNLAIAALFVLAAIRLTRSLVDIAAIAALLGGVPHLVYHLANTDGLSSSDIALSLTGLALFVALPIVLLTVSRNELVDGGAASERGIADRV